MTTQQKAQALAAAVRRLCGTSPEGTADGPEVARAAGFHPDDPSLYSAFREAQRLGLIGRPYWAGGMALPVALSYTG